MVYASLCVSLISCSIATLALAIKSSGSPPQATQSFLNSFDERSGDRQAFRVASDEYELHRMAVRHPDNSRYGLELVWVTIAPATYEFSVIDSRKDGNIRAVFEDAARPASDVLLINGGYFGQRGPNHFIPMGLVVSNGVRISKLWHWTSGGVLFATSNTSSVRIVPIGAFETVGETSEAIQSKPLLVEHSRSSIRTDDHQHANRTAVAVCRDSTLLFAGAFADGGAVSLYEFAALLSSGKLCAAPIEYALNMDGGPGAHIFIPSLRLHFGSDTATYIPDLIRVSGKHR